jgi:predicted kinase
VTPWLVITCGLPFSGKTTLSREVAARTGLVRVSVDDLVPNLGRDGAGMTPSSTWRDAYLQAIRQTEEHLGRGESVVFDSVGHTRKNRYRLARVAKRADARSLIVRLAVGRSEALARLESNRATPTRPYVPIDGFNEIADAFEEPAETECVLTYSPNQSLATWIDETLVPHLNGA